MTITKNERRLAIGVGIALGIVFSSMLVRYAFQTKEQKMQDRAGNYATLETAFDGLPFDPLPEEVRDKLKHGIVIHYDSNQSILSTSQRGFTRSWVIEIVGSFRSERLFVLAEQTLEGNSSRISFYRASELYLKFHDPVNLDKFKLKLDQDRFRIIGKNSSSEEWILQIKKFSPRDILNTMAELMNEFPELSGIRPVNWAPPR